MPMRGGNGLSEDQAVPADPPVLWSPTFAQSVRGRNLGRTGSPMGAPPPSASCTICIGDARSPGDIESPFGVSPVKERTFELSDSSLLTAGSPEVSRSGSATKALDLPLFGGTPTPSPRALSLPTPPNPSPLTPTLASAGDEARARSPSPLACGQCNSAKVLHFEDNAAREDGTSLLFVEALSKLEGNIETLVRENMQMLEMQWSIKSDPVSTGLHRDVLQELKEAAEAVYNNRLDSLYLGSSVCSRLDKSFAEHASKAQLYGGDVDGMWAAAEELQRAFRLEGMWANAEGGSRSPSPPRSGEVKRREQEALELELLRGRLDLAQRALKLAGPQNALLKQELQAVRMPSRRSPMCSGPSLWVPGADSCAAEPAHRARDGQMPDAAETRKGPSVPPGRGRSGAYALPAAPAMPAHEKVPKRSSSGPAGTRRSGRSQTATGASLGNSRQPRRQGAPGQRS